MPHPVGTYLGGIRTVEDLKARCTVDDITECWHWSLSIHAGAPRVTFMAPDTKQYVKTRGRKAALYLERGVDMPKGHVAYAKMCCKSTDCCNPEHSRSGTKKQWGDWLAQSGAVKGLPSKCAGARKAWDKRGRTLTPEMVAEIRRSNEPDEAIGARFGVTGYAVWSVRRGLTHSSGMNGSSVFGWRP